MGNFVQTTAVDYGPLRVITDYGGLCVISFFWLSNIDPLFLTWVVEPFHFLVVGWTATPANAQTGASGLRAFLAASPKRTGEPLDKHHP